MAFMEELENYLKKRSNLIGDNSIYGLPMYKLDNKTYEYSRNDAIDIYRYLAEYMAIKPLDIPVTATEMLENSRRNNIMMNRSDEVYLVQWKKKEDGSVSSGSIKLLGKVTRGIEKEPKDVTYIYNDSSTTKYLSSPSSDRELELTITQNIWDTGDFATVLQRLTHYAEVGTDMKRQEAINKLRTYMPNNFAIKKVIFSGPCTIVFWQDGTKTMVRQQGSDILDKEKGLAMAIAKRALGDKGNYNNVFKRWIYGEDWKKKERFVKKAIKLAKKNGDLAEADILKNSMKKNLDYTFAMAETYLQDSNSTPLEKAIKTIKDKIDDAMSIGFKGKRKDMGVIDEATDSDEED